MTVDRSVSRGKIEKKQGRGVASLRLEMDFGGRLIYSESAAYTFATTRSRFWGCPSRYTRNQTGSDNAPRCFPPARARVLPSDSSSAESGASHKIPCRRRFAGECSPSATFAGAWRGRLRRYKDCCHCAPGVEESGSSRWRHNRPAAAAKSKRAKVSLT